MKYLRHRGFQILSGFFLASLLSGYLYAGEHHVHQGKSWYSRAGCEACHGKRGDGNGPAGAALNPKPPNFCGPTKHPTDHLKFKMIAEGGARMGHSSLMPPYGSVLDQEAISNIVAYIHSLCDARASR